jgi:hypothetical protein
MRMDDFLRKDAWGVFPHSLISIVILERIVLKVIRKIPGFNPGR